MAVNLVTVLVVLAVMVSQTSENLFPKAFNCCREISEEIPKGILQRAEWYEIQKAGDLCNLEAVILYIEDKKFCVSPQITRVKKWMKKMKHKMHRRKSHVRRHLRTRITKENGPKRALW